MVRTSILWILIVTACINSAVCGLTDNSNYSGSRVLSVDVKSLHPTDNGAFVAGEPSQLILFGKYLQENVQVTLTQQAGLAGGPCPHNEVEFTPLAPYKYMLLNDYSKIFVFVPESVAKHMYGERNVWLCYRTDKLSDWIHYGENSRISVKSRLVGRRHLLRRSLIDDLTPAKSQTSSEVIVSDKMSANARETRATNAETATGPSIDTLPAAVPSEVDEFRTSNGMPASGDIDAARPPGAHESDMTMSMLEEEYPTQLSANAVQTPVHSGMRIYGMRVEHHSKGLTLEANTITLMADTDAFVRIFGYGLTNQSRVQFTTIEQEYGSDCDISTSDMFELLETGEGWATLTVKLPPLSAGQERWYICLRSNLASRAIHQGSAKWLAIATYTSLLPLWVQSCLLVILLMLSGLFSGLNLGLMALDKTELKIVSNTGTPKERRYAKSIEPIRSHGNFLLCTLLLGNVLVNSTLTILLDTLSTGLIAVIGSTIGIVIFGEIIPQAVCSRHGLAIGANTVWLVRLFMVVTGVVSWPISKILDKALGEELGNTYDRERLKELIRVTQDSNDIRLEEQNIICGALELHRKTVVEIMTKIEDVFMLSVSATLDFNTINDIMQQGYSRIPIYDTERCNIISVLFIKDLAFIDPDDDTPLRTLSQFYQNPCLYIFEDTTLDIVFKEFKRGNKGHMAFVQKVINQNDCDPYYETIGLVTIEDVIEELIQEEIVDETDVFVDNRTKQKRKALKRRDFKEFYQTNNPTSHRKVQISPQMQVAALQFLRTSVEPFKEGHLSEGILKKILAQDIIHVIKPVDKSSPPEPEDFIYVQAKPADYFVLILEGHVEVTMGRENLKFESGPFSYFGVSALTVSPVVGESPSLPNQLSRGSIQSLEPVKSSFSPDFSITAATDVTFLKIRRQHYFAARRAFLLQQSQKDPQAEDNFELEMAKIISDENMLFLDSGDKAASMKDTLPNGGAVRNCNGDADKIVRASMIRKMSASLASTPSKDKSISDPNEPSPVSPEDEEC